MRRRGRKRQYLGVLCLAVVISLSAMGVGFSAWQEDLQVEGAVATGNIDVVFTGGPDDNCDNVYTDIVDQGKRLVIDVTDAHPYYNRSFPFRLENTGTVPVRYEMHALSLYADEGVEVYLVKEPQKGSEDSGRRKKHRERHRSDSADAGVLGPGEKAHGVLHIDLDRCRVQPDSDYDFTVELVFRQWNAVN